MNKLTQTLNTQQQVAVNHVEGPLLVLAGAGSGKTRVVTNRIIRLMEIGVPASEILAITFTNKAAEEMKKRINQQTCDVIICTFHSLGTRILRNSLENMEQYSNDFVIYDKEDTDKLIYESMKELEITKKQFSPKIFKSLIAMAKNKLQKPEDIDELENQSTQNILFTKIYSIYQAKLREYNALDFDDLLFMTVRLFQERKDILEIYQKQWPFILIDEYQDTNHSQYIMTKLLAGTKQNIFAVGDPDQSIYSWRGADMDNIMNFEKDFPGATIIRLEQNYRSKANILNAANVLISYNENRYHKNLWSNQDEGEKISVVIAKNEYREVDYVVKKIINYHHGKDIPFNDMVIFYRTNSQSRPFEDTLLSHNIPYVIVGGISFYQRREIKDILATLRMICSESDYISFARTINLPRRGIGNATIEKIRREAKKAKLPILSYCNFILNNESLNLAKKQKEGLINYLSIIKDLKEYSKDHNISDLVKYTIEHSGYISVLRQDQETFDDRKSNLDELITKASEYDQSSLEAFLEELSLKSTLDDVKEEEDKLNLMTIHNGKGLEFVVTFIVGLEENLFPHVNSKDNSRSLEEERRLCYVGMTRTKEKLFLTAAKQRSIWGSSRKMTPSRFLREIPTEYIINDEEPKVEYRDKRKDNIQEKKTFSIGDIIIHNDFGVGIIKGMQQCNMGLIYKIFFQKDLTTKTLVAKYANLELMLKE